MFEEIMDYGFHMIARDLSKEDEGNSEIIKISPDFKVEPAKRIVSLNDECRKLNDVVLEGEGLPWFYENIEYKVIFSVNNCSELGIVLDSLDRPDLVEEVEDDNYSYKVDFSELKNLINSEIPMHVKLVKTETKSFNFMGYECWRANDEA